MESCLICKQGYVTPIPNNAKEFIVSREFLEEATKFINEYHLMIINAQLFATGSLVQIIKERLEELRSWTEQYHDIIHSP